MKLFLRPALAALSVGILFIGCGGEVEGTEPVADADAGTELTMDGDVVVETEDDELFDDFDTDDDGYLSELEFDSGVGEPGLFGTYDADADGRLTRDEFEAYGATL